METQQTKKAKRKKRRSRHIFRRILITLLILALLAGIGWYLYNSLRAEYTVIYQQYNATVGTISNALSFNGTLQAVNDKTYTANKNGTVKNVYVQAGQQVKDGDRLVRLSTGQTVEAEFDGTVNVMNCEEGDEVVAGDTLCQVVDFVHMKTSIRVDEYDISNVHAGDRITVTVTANEKQFESAIDTINYTSSSSGSVAYYTATAFVDVAEEVYPGMQVTVTLPQEEATDVVILKMDAISFDEKNSAFVYMKDENGEMQEIYITTGVSNGSYTEIKSGLSDGDTVYTQVEVETENTVTSLLGGLFGRSQINGGGMSSNNGGRERSVDRSDMPEGFDNFGGGSDSRGGSDERGGFGGAQGGFGGGN